MEALGGGPGENDQACANNFDGTRTLSSRGVFPGPEGKRFAAAGGVQQPRKGPPRLKRDFESRAPPGLVAPASIDLPVPQVLKNIRRISHRKADARTGISHC